ncbi:glucose-1-phosphate thymidylyltransferase [Nonomuraea polychroma]|uniref:Glucose-1-phosphate thymidylyltransferase n=1 Tax=Nonomuraea polychroma TaxID=46176 RepID=A0A438LYY9_9ACTN|nr:glucose-1-phosphate thymidylyltransferase [Nonomuraea polychroma]RVX38756.1 glucose-1-phosphate thymidylyltransferase [Nonomuraea polychroma]
MKALVLAGGAGTRLRPFSHSMPKQLVPIAGKPVLFHALDALRATGITEAGIIVSGTDAAIRASVGDGSRFDMTVTYLPQDRPRGLAHCVMIARDFLADDDFVMYLGDNIFAEGIAGPVGAFVRDRAAAQLVVTKVMDPSQYGVAELDATGRVTALEEKPAHPRTDLAVTGLYCFTPEIHEAVGRIEPSWRNEFEITDAVRWLVDQDRPVRAELLSGYWADTGTLADLLECNRVLLEGITGAVHGTVDSRSRISGPVVIEAGTTIEGSTITGPAIIGAGCAIVDSHVGPFTSLGTRCTLTAAGVEHSILMDDASVHGVRLQKGSIIGRAGKVSQGGSGAASHRLLIGDDSRVEVPA